MLVINSALKSLHNSLEHAIVLDRGAAMAVAITRMKHEFRFQNLSKPCWSEGIAAAAVKCVCFLPMMSLTM